MDDHQLLRYSRHLLLEEVGLEAQQRLLESCALVVGAGGLGCPAALYLAAAGVGRILLADPDTVDLTNLQRQILHHEDRIGQPKVLSAQSSLRSINARVEVVPIAQRLEGDALAQAVRASQVVLDCSDNFATRHAVNQACVAAGVPLVSGAGVRFDGQIAVFDPRAADSACYHCLFPASVPVEDVQCATLGVFAPLTGIIGTMQAAEAMKLLGGFGSPLRSTLLMLDARTMECRRIRVPRDPDCPVCGAG